MGSSSAINTTLEKEFGARSLIPAMERRTPPSFPSGKETGGKEV
jgi:hypothetical protein